MPDKAGLGHHALVVLNVLLVLATCGNPGAALVFFACAFVVVRLRHLAPARHERAAVALAVLALVLLLLRFRYTSLETGSRLFVETASAWLPPAGSAWRADLSFLGASYAFLRAVHAAWMPGPWTTRELVAYFFFFPTFASGPVMTRGDMPQGGLRLAWNELGPALSHALDGTLRIGAAAVLATVALLASPEQALHGLRTWHPLALWAGLASSGLWLYLNFSGFSEIYRGMGRLFGARVPANFDNPYAACDITAFWQRWHVSLGNWLRSIVYTPVSRLGVGATPGAALVVAVAGPVVTMLACGAWHRVAPAFLAWGALHGIALAAHVLWSRLLAPRLPSGLRAHAAYRAASWCLTHALVTASWVMFLPTGPGLAFGDRCRLALALVGLGDA